MPAQESSEKVLCDVLPKPDFHYDFPLIFLSFSFPSPFSLFIPSPRTYSFCHLSSCSFNNSKTSRSVLYFFQTSFIVSSSGCTRSGIIIARRPAPDADLHPPVHLPMPPSPPALPGSLHRQSDKFPDPASHFLPYPRKHYRQNTSILLLLSTSSPHVLFSKTRRPQAYTHSLLHRQAALSPPVHRQAFRCYNFFKKCSCQFIKPLHRKSFRMAVRKYCSLLTTLNPSYDKYVLPFWEFRAPLLLGSRNAAQRALSQRSVRPYQKSMLLSSSVPYVSPLFSSVLSFQKMVSIFLLHTNYVMKIIQFVQKYHASMTKMYFLNSSRPLIQSLLEMADTHSFYSIGFLHLELLFSLFDNFRLHLNL